MFEDSFVEAQVRAADWRRGWLVTASLVCQAGAAAGLIVLPLLLPDRLAARVWAVRSVPTLHVPPPPAPKALPAVGSKAAPAFSTIAPGRAVESAPRIRSSADPAPAVTDLTPGLSWSNAGPLSRIVDAVGGGSRNVGVAPANPAVPGKGLVRVSSGVAAGLLVAPIRPAYPPIAAHAGVQGVVVVEAVISRSGAIESAHVVSGPALLRDAALAAVSAARYQPYRLNGEPVEVQTTISIHFNLGG